MVPFVSALGSDCALTSLLTKPSHPGYGCWLSGIDVNTQLTNQKHNDPYLAVVVSDSATPHAGTDFQQIDPNRTVSAGKVEIGAFRTYPEVSVLRNFHSPTHL